MHTSLKTHGPGTLDRLEFWERLTSAPHSVECHINCWEYMLFPHLLTTILYQFPTCIRTCKFRQGSVFHGKRKKLILLYKEFNLAQEIGSTIKTSNLFYNLVILTECNRLIFHYSQKMLVLVKG